MKATEITICVFTNTGKNRVFEFDASGEIAGINFGNLTEKENEAFNAAEQAVSKLAAPDAKVSLWVCPLDYNNNVVVINQNNFGLNLPAILLTAYYPTNEKKQYAIPNTLGGLKNWSIDDVYPYLRALYLNKFGAENQALICKLLPQVCEWGAYVWLAAAVGSTYKAIEVDPKRPVLKSVWGVSAALAWEAFLKGDGLDKLFKK